MVRQIELEVDGVTAVAELLEEKAPKLCQRLWDALPMEQTLRHVRWGGNAAYFISRELRDPSFPLENRYAFYDPATIAFKPEHGEFAFSYGQAQARSLSGNGWSIHFANIEGDAEPFLRVLAATQHDGKKQIVIRRREQ